MKNYTDVPLYSIAIKMHMTTYRSVIDPLRAKLCYRNFHPFEAVRRYSDPQLQVDKNTYICLILYLNFGLLSNSHITLSPVI